MYCYCTKRYRFISHPKKQLLKNVGKFMNWLAAWLSVDGAAEEDEMRPRRMWLPMAAVLVCDGFKWL